jgi:hypothetical protein
MVNGRQKKMTKCKEKRIQRVMLLEDATIHVLVTYQAFD